MCCHKSNQVSIFWGPYVKNTQKSGHSRVAALNIGRCTKFCIALSAFLLAFPLVARPRNLALTRPTSFEARRDRLKRRFAEACRNRKFMGAVLITANGREVFSGACGWTNLQWNIKNTVDTRFLIGSITKEFTAAAIALLSQEKKFALSDPIGKYLPNLPDPWQAATIHQLLTHTSGIPIYTDRKSTRL